MANVPYEFLVRWDHHTGVLKGAHVKVYDNVEMSEGDAQPVAVAGASGFPLGEILTAVELKAIVAMEAAQAELAAEKAAHAVTKNALTTAETALAAQ